jgi:hypothetical protein
MRTALALASACVLLAPAASAFGQGSPFSPLPPPPAPEQTAPPSPAPTNRSVPGGGLETWQQILIFGAGAALLLGIARVIVADARRSAPVKAAAKQGPPPRDRTAERARARARAKAARKQRRRTAKRTRR